MFLLQTNNMTTILPNIMTTKPSSSVCDHPILYHGVCAICNLVLLNDETTGIAFNYITKGLRISHDEIARIRQIQSQNLFAQRKLCLVLDLDNTLVHTKPINTLTPDEEYLMESGCLDGDLFMWGPMITKLRPFVRDFLEEASQFFDLCIYTLGDRTYALQMASFLDPKNVYFNSSKVISKEDCTMRGQKCLDVVLVDESAVVIVDDKDSVWKRNSNNLVVINKYTYFVPRGNVNGSTSKSYAELRIDESQANGGLRCALQVLKRIHSAFFLQFNLLYRDVRYLVEFLRGLVLKGCNIVLGEGAVTPSTGYCQLWRMAEEMGATCSGECCSPPVTHVVSTDHTSSEAQWAVKHGKYLVDPTWISSAYYVWKRQPENMFMVTQMDSCKENMQPVSVVALGKRSRCDDGSTLQGLEKRQRSLNVIL